MRVLLLLCFILPALGGRPSQQIVGGVAADEGEWPWQLAFENFGSFSCGANLLGPTWGVCAAHCVGGAPASYAVVAGTNQRSCGDGNCQRRTLVRADRNADFVNSGALGFPNDISYIEWSPAIDEVPGKIQYVPPATTTDQGDGRPCFITGWGRLSGGGILPENLQEAQIDIITNTECAALWTDASINDGHVCVYDTVNQAKGACNGDSGGPLVCQLPDTTWELVGLTSWGRTGCSTAWPSVYTRISYFYNWIITCRDTGVC